jgi:hypothetical protein
LIYLSDLFDLLTNLLRNNLFDLLTNLLRNNLFDLLTNLLRNMSDKLLPLQHESVLKLLQLPGIKEKLEEERKKYCNSTAYKEWEKADEPFEEDEEVLSMKNEKNEAHHGANSQSVDDNAESKSVGKLLLIFYLINKTKLI